jgi:hypothetical protein
MPWFWHSDGQKQGQDALPAQAALSSDEASRLPEPPKQLTNTPSSDDETERTLGQFMPIFADSQAQSERPKSTKDSLREKLPSRHETDAKVSEIVTFPDTMSCRQAFDDAFYCNSLGGQFNHVYRYGSVRSCSDNWSQFWFCMRTRSKSEESKREAIQDWYRKKEAKHRAGPNSEDIWEERSERVERAFDWDPDAAGILAQKKEG